FLCFRSQLLTSFLLRKTRCFSSFVLVVLFSFQRAISVSLTQIGDFINLTHLIVDVNNLF
ncbi:hypothetical protein M3E13_05425, partial [Oceanobacillus kimchii]|uniref:hypothetical protein n=1 Tax=Oceanobacillus kimchii TaxID=746691 RepID=UPI0021A2F0BC